MHTLNIMGLVFWANAIRSFIYENLANHPKFYLAPHKSDVITIMSLFNNFEFFKCFKLSEFLKCYWVFCVYTKKYQFFLIKTYCYLINGWRNIVFFSKTCCIYIKYLKNPIIYNTNQIFLKNLVHTKISEYFEKFGKQ